MPWRQQERWCQQGTGGCVWLCGGSWGCCGAPSPKPWLPCASPAAPEPAAPCAAAAGEFGPTRRPGLAPHAVGSQLELHGCRLYHQSLLLLEQLQAFLWLRGGGNEQVVNVPGVDAKNNWLVTAPHLLLKIELLNECYSAKGFFSASFLGTI